MEVANQSLVNLADAFGAVGIDGLRLGNKLVQKFRRLLDAAKAKMPGIKLKEGNACDGKKSESDNEHEAPPSELGNKTLKEFDNGFKHGGCVNES